MKRWSWFIFSCPGLIAIARSKLEPAIKYKIELFKVSQWIFHLHHQEGVVSWNRDSFTLRFFLDCLNTVKISSVGLEDTDTPRDETLRNNLNNFQRLCRRSMKQKCGGFIWILIGKLLILKQWSSTIYSRFVWVSWQGWVCRAGVSLYLQFDTVWKHSKAANVYQGSFRLYWDIQHCNTMLLLYKISNTEASSNNWLFRSLSYWWYKWVGWNLVREYKSREVLNLFVIFDLTLAT